MTAPPMPIPFPLSWSHYVRLPTIADDAARAYYEHEAQCGGWSVRDLDRQLGSFTLARRPQSGLHDRPRVVSTLLHDPLVLRALHEDAHHQSEVK